MEYTLDTVTAQQFFDDVIVYNIINLTPACILTPPLSPSFPPSMSPPPPPNHIIAQQITQPPVNTTAALGTNATFSCSGVGDQIFWEASGTVITTAELVMNFASQVQVYAPLPTDQGSSELFVMATIGNNASLPIRCNVGVGNIVTGTVVESSTVFLTVYGE